MRFGHRRRRGSAMLEFTMAGIAAATMLITTVQVGLGMWNYHTLAYAVHETNRYIIVHGRDCGLGGNSCLITVANIASKLQSNAIGLVPANLSMTLTSNSGTVYTCNPLTSCSTDSTQWPPVNKFDNMAGNNSTIKASYSFNNALIILWFGKSGMRIGNMTLAASSKVPILF